MNEYKNISYKNIMIGGMDPAAAAAAAGAVPPGAANALGAAGGLPPEAAAASGAAPPAKAVEAAGKEASSPVKSAISDWYNYSALNKLDKMVKFIVDEPCLKNIKIDGGIPSISENQSMSEYAIDSIKKFLNYSGILNWNKYGKGGRMRKIPKLRATRKLLFCFIKLALSPLYLFYIFFKLFVIFLKALNLFNFGKAIVQIFCLIIGGLLSITVIGTPIGLGLVNYSKSMQYQMYDNDNNPAGTKVVYPFESALKYYGGMVLPLQLISRKWGHTYGYGSLTLMSIAIIFVSGFLIIYGGIAMGIILAVFISYLYRVIVGLKAGATSSSDSGTTKP